MANVVNQDPPQRAELARRLCDPNFSLSEVKERGTEAIALAVEILRIFGERFANLLEGSIKNAEMQRRFRDTRVFSDEIQTGLQKGPCTYSPTHLPNTAAVIKETLPVKASESAYFALLKRHSYDCRPDFPQRVFLHQAPNLSVLEEIEDVDRKAFALMMSLLDSQPREGRLDPQTETALTRCFLSPALRYDGKPVHFNILIRQWEKFSPPNREKVNSLLKLVPLFSWVQEEPDPANLLTFLKHGHDNPSFKTYLIRCSIEALEKNLDAKFSPAVEKYLQEQFQNERVRSDVCFFSGRLPALYLVNLPEKRESKPLLLSLQLFLFLTRTYGIRTEAHTRLLEMLLYRNTVLKTTLVPPTFEVREWKEPVNEEDEHFATLWGGMMGLLDILQKNPTDRYAWPLFSFFFLHERGTAFLQVFSTLVGVHGMTLSLSDLYQFCHLNRDASEGHVHKLGTTYALALNTYHTEKERHLPHPQLLFFVPPIDLTTYSEFDMGMAGHITANFINKMDALQFPVEKSYVRLLRHFLLKKSLFLFLFLEDGPVTKARDVAFQEKALSTDHAHFDSQFSDRKLAKQIVLQQHRKFQFSDIELFNLYVEFTRLIAQGKAGLLGVISEIVTQLDTFCPVFDDAYFLFRYHPEEIKISDIRALAEMKDALVKDTSRSPHDILDFVDQLVTSMSAACPHEEERGRFIDSCKKALWAASREPWQPLGDSFRITDVTPDGPEWQAEHLRTHLGTLTPILKRARLSVYCHWTLDLSNRPTLFFSFYNPFTRVGHSAFVPFQISAQNFKRDSRERPFFYGALMTFSRLLFMEEVDAEMVRGARENFQPDIDQRNLTIDQIEEMERFLREVKAKYQTLFRSSGADPLLPDDDFKDSLQMASTGHIFNSHRRGALLPPSLLWLGMYPVEPFISDIEPPNPAIFKARPQKHDPEPLDRNLTVLDVEEKLLHIPISYQVQSARQLMGEEVAADPNEPQGSYVTLCIPDWKIPLYYPPEVLQDSEKFQAYFDFHILLLKAHHYRSLFRT